MGENALLEIASQLKSGKSAREIRDVRGTCWYTGKKEEIEEFVKSFENQPETKRPVFLPAYEKIKADNSQSKELFAQSFLIQEQNTDAINAQILIEQADSRFVVQNPPAFPLSTQQMDMIYEMPFTRRWHPMYDKPAENGKNGIPALQEVKFSLTSCRGCFGACSFCAITFHQGRRIQVRSHENILQEAVKMTEDKDFKGYIHDVGGPTANFRQDACKNQKISGACKNKDCLGTKPCKNLEVSHTDYVELLQKLRNLPKVKKFLSVREFVLII